MKKIIIAIVAALLLTAAYAAGQERNPASLYPLTGRIIELDAENDVVTFEDYNGFTWQFFGIEDYQMFDTVSVIMDDQGTEIIFDDHIVTVNYDGWDLSRR